MPPLLFQFPIDHKASPDLVWKGTTKGCERQEARTRGVSQDNAREGKKTIYQGCVVVCPIIIF